MSNNVLIAYYSWSGNTRRIAEMIHETVGGNVIEICPEVPYSNDYNEVLNRAKKEIRDKFRPSLLPTIDNISAYDKIFIGSPNWWSTIAPPVTSFLDEHDFKGKFIFPFCTHGGGGQGNILQAITKLCPFSTVSDCISFHGSGSNNNHGAFSAWIKNAEIVN